MTETDVPFDDSEGSFCKIKVDEFITSTSLHSDIFIKLNPGKFIKIARENTAIDIERIRHYKDKNVDYFLVRNSDFHKYTGLNLKVARAANAVSSIPPEKKLQLFKHTGEILLQQVFISGLNRDLCTDAQMILNNTLSVVSQNDDLLELLIIMQASGDRIFSHSVAVSAYACMIAKKRGWVSTPNQYKLSMASLFHDVGWRELPRELQAKTRIKMTPEEVRQRETHPGRGRDILSQMKGFPTDIVQIVYQHHETQLGSGFPLGLQSSKIHPLAKVLHLADEFSYSVIDNQCKTKEDAQEVARSIFATKGDEFDPESMVALFESLDLASPRRSARM